MSRLPTLVRSPLLLLLRAFFLNQSLVPFFVLAGILVNLLFSIPLAEYGECREFCIPHVFKGFKGFNGDFFTLLLFKEFDFIAYTWDFPEPEPVLVLNGDERPSAASGTNWDRELCYFLTVLAAALVYIYYSNN